MNHIMASLFVDVHPSNDKLTLFRDGDYSWMDPRSMSIPSCKQCYGWWWWTAVLGHILMLYMTVVTWDLITRSMDYTPRRIPTWGSHSMCLGQIRRLHSSSPPVGSILSLNSVNMDQSWMSNMTFLSELTIGIPRLPWLVRMPKAASSTVELVNSVTSNSVNLFNLAMWAFASKCFPIELVAYSDGYHRTWWQTIHLMPGLLVSSIPQCKSICQDGACLEWLQGIARFEPTFIEIHYILKMICKPRLLKSRIKTCSFLEVMMTSNNEVFKDCESDIAVAIWWLSNSTRETAKNYVVVKWNAGSWILTLEVQAKKVRSVRHCMHICQVVYKEILKRLTVRYWI